MLAEMDRIARKLEAMREENTKASRHAERISWIQTILSILIGFVLGKATQWFGF
jgi:hypothetical protein